MRKATREASSRDVQIAKVGGEERLAELIARVEAGKPLTIHEVREIPKDDLRAARRRYKESKVVTATTREEPSHFFIMQYSSGLPELPNGRSGKLRVYVLADRFVIDADGPTARRFWTDLQVPYSAVEDVRLVTSGPRELAVISFNGGAGERVLELKFFGVRKRTRLKQRREFAASLAGTPVG